MEKYDGKIQDNYKSISLMKEQIQCAAIWFHDNLLYDHQPMNVKSGFVVCGHRHHNCFMTAYILQSSREYIKLNKTQGFLTNTNRFVDRYEAFKIAKEANQILEDSSLYLAKEGKLYSEDLY